MEESFAFLPVVKSAAKAAAVASASARLQSVFGRFEEGSSGVATRTFLPCFVGGFFDAGAVSAGDETVSRGVGTVSGGDDVVSDGDETAGFASSAFGGSLGAVE